MDKCFKKDSTVFIIPQLVEPFKTHIIGTELEPGTVCTFHATTRDFWDRITDTVSASCTVGGMSTIMYTPPVHEKNIYCTYADYKMPVHIIQIQIHHCQLTALFPVIHSSVSVPVTQDSLDQMHSLNVSFFKDFIKGLTIYACMTACYHR